jgi:hypothetical protein
MSVFLSHLVLQSWSTAQHMRPSQHAAVVIFYAGLTLGVFDLWPAFLSKLKVKASGKLIIWLLFGYCLIVV